VDSNYWWDQHSKVGLFTDASNVRMLTLNMGGAQSCILFETTWLIFVRVHAMVLLVLVLSLMCESTSQRIAVQLALSVLFAIRYLPIVEVQVTSRTTCIVRLL